MGQRLDLQLTAPFDLGRRTDALVLELFTTHAERGAQLRDQDTATVCAAFLIADGCDAANLSVDNG